MDKLTKKFLVILVVVAMVLASPLAVLAEDIGDCSPVLNAPVAGEYLLDDVSGDDYPEAGYPGDDYPEAGYSEEDYSEDDYPEAGYPEDGDLQRGMTLMVDIDELDLEDVESAMGEVTVGELLGFLRDDLQEIRDRVQADFYYVANNIDSFPGTQAELDDLITFWNQELDALEVLLSDEGFELFIQLLMNEGMSLEEALEAALEFLVMYVTTIEYEILLDLRESGFDILGPGCPDCPPGTGPIGCPTCWCYLCRGNNDPNCRFCNEQPNGIVLCDICREYPCICDVVWCPICGLNVEFCPHCQVCEEYPCVCVDDYLPGGGTPTPGPVVMAAPQTGDSVQASLPLAALVLSSSVLLGGGLLKKRPGQD